jgi:hypothetical protein
MYTSYTQLKTSKFSSYLVFDFLIEKVATKGNTGRLACPRNGSPLFEEQNNITSFKGISSH